MGIKKQQPISNAAVVDKCTQRLAALKQYVQAKAEIPIDGETKKLADVIAVYQDCLDTRASLQTKRPVRTADSKAKAVLQAEATRKARHTMGSVQKKHIKGTIVVSTAPAAPATNAPPTVPVASAPPATSIVVSNGAPARLPSLA